MKYLNKLLIIVFLIGASGCNLTDLDLQDDPNAVPPDKAEIDFVYNSVVISYREFIEDIWFFPSTVTRMRAMIGGNLYNNAYTPADFNGMWGEAYANLFPDIDLLLSLAADGGFDIHAGTAKIMKAYVMMALVDIFGDVPFSEAGQGSDILSPKVDDGAAIYAQAETLLTEAIDQLKGASAPAPANDVFYNGSASKWITLANTLKFRIYMTTRLVDGGAKDKIQGLIDAGDIIDTEDEDFQFDYGSNRVNPNSRHPLYNDWYEATDGDYMSTYYMWLLWDEKGIVDPRIRFYFYRQDLNLADTDQNVWECVFSIFPDLVAPGQNARPDHFEAVDPDMPYCIAAVEGYFGRDHGNNQGIPPDGPIRTAYGLYPAGGKFDDNSAVEVQQNGTLGALGAGIQPIMLSSFVDFLRAEAALVLGTSDDARAMLESGVKKSLNKVISFKDKVDLTAVVGQDLDGNPITAEEAFVPAQEELDAYVAKVLELYDNATTQDEKLDVIMKEYFIALWGNGIEAYNNYRRTGKPANLQPTLEPNSGNFIRSALYPADFVNRNSSVTQKSTDDLVFWDDGSADVF